MKADMLIMRQIEKDVEEANKPYSQIDHKDLETHQRWLKKWFADPQHDHLRALGRLP